MDGKVVTDEQIKRGCEAGRKTLNDYSRFYSSMVPDAALRAFVVSVLRAALPPSPKE